MGDLSKSGQLSISVAVLTGNRDPLLNRLLMELQRQLLVHDEIVILDTTGRPATQKIVKDFQCAAINYYDFSGKPFDFATARNELVRRCTKDGIAFIDDDAYPFPDWLVRVRDNLARYDAVGGPSIAAGALPEWWEQELNWTIGLSPLGVILGEPGYYPSAGNMAARTYFFRKYPFITSPMESTDLYGGGREDAQWWMECRLRGDNVAIDSRQAVSHDLHPERLNWDYFKRRAQIDGAADWWRDPSREKALAAPPNLAHFCLSALTKGRQISIHRHWGQLRAIWKSPGKMRPARSVLVSRYFKGILLEIQHRTSNIVWLAVRKLRIRGSFPPEAPKIIFVSANCLMGDSVLLRRHINTLAVSFQNAQVIVSAKYPQLLAGISDNVRVINASESQAYLAVSWKSIELAIVPYYHSGDGRIWRKHLSAVGRTFDVDVGFDRNRDYLLARTRVPKDFQLHEHENLSRLFRVWPQHAIVEPIPAPVKVVDEEWWRQAAAERGICNGYVVIYLGAGYEAKEWPVDSWISFLHLFCESIPFPIVVVGSTNEKLSGDTLVKETGAYNVTSLAGMTDVGKLCAILSKATFVVGACSGPGHIARMYQVPTFTLYGATEPYRWGAVDDMHLHDYAWGLKEKLTAPELLGRSVDFRMKLLDPVEVAKQAINHFGVVRPLGPTLPFSPGRVE